MVEKVLGFLLASLLLFEGVSCAPGEVGVGPLESDEFETENPNIICGQPPDTGLCRGYFPRFHFDPYSRTCRQFIFGGCGGNANSFDDEKSCYEMCNGTNPVPYPTTPPPTYPPNIAVICRQPRDAGNCSELEIRYFYNMRNGACQAFTWSGCGGNENRFSSLADCYSNCFPDGNYPHPPTRQAPASRILQTTPAGILPDIGILLNRNLGTQNLTSSTRIATTTQKLTTTTTQQMVPQRTRTTTTTTQPSTSTTQKITSTITTKTDAITTQSITTSTTTPVRTSTKSRLITLYTVPAEDYYDYEVRAHANMRPRILANVQTGYEETIRTVETPTPTTTTTEIPFSLAWTTTRQIANVCYRPKDRGSYCHGNAIWRYYYEPAYKVCKMFTYTGCGGNENNFVSLQQCRKTCEQPVWRPGIWTVRDEDLTTFPTTPKTTTQNPAPSRRPPASLFNGNDFYGAVIAAGGNAENVMSIFQPRYANCQPENILKVMLNIDFFVCRNACMDLDVGPACSGFTYNALTKQCQLMATPCQTTPSGSNSASGPRSAANGIISNVGVSYYYAKLYFATH